MILSYNRVSRLFIEKHEYINVNSKIYIVYTLKPTRNKNETESGTRNQTFKGPTQDMIGTTIWFFCTIMLKSKRWFTNQWIWKGLCLTIIALCGQALIITCTLIIGRICTGHCNLWNKHCLFQASRLYLFTSFTSWGHFFKARLFFGISGKT